MLRLEGDILSVRTRPFHHALRRMGFTASDVLLLGAAPALRTAWVVGTCAVLLFALNRNG